MRIVASVVMLTVGLCACGCGGQGSTASAKRAPLTEPVSPGVVARDRALGEQALLRESDFPRSYTAAPRGGEEEPWSATHLLQKAATSCAQLNAPVLAHKNPATVSQQVGEAGEPASGEGAAGYVKIDSTVTVEPTVAAAREWFSILDQSQIPSCIGEAERSLVIKESPGLLKPGNSVGKTRAGQMAFPSYGDQTVAYRLIVPIIAEGHNLSVYFDYVLVRKGRAHVMITFTRVDSPVTSTMEQRVTALTARRLRA